MKDDKLLDRIRKLLAMAGDAGSPNEAAIAMRRARALMDKHQIQEMDLKQDQSDLGIAKVVYFEQWTGQLALQIARLNDCIADITTGTMGLPIVRFKGYLVDATTSQEMFPYLTACAMRGAKGLRGKKQKAGFFRGFAAGIKQQVDQILAERQSQVLGDGRALVIVKGDVVKAEFGAQRYGPSRHASYDSATYASGVAAGQNASLNRQCTGAGQGRLK